MIGRFVNHTGKIFGRLTVIEYLKTFKKWKCLCECGNHKNIRAGDLLSGDIKSCGCLFKETIKKIRTPDITGKTFGQLTVLEYDDKKGINTYWLCLCKCGNVKSIRYGHLTSGNIVSCGCFGKQQHKTHGKSKDKDYYKHLRSDPCRKIKFIISRAVRQALKLKYINKSNDTFNCLPYTPQQLKEHIESLWEPWMTWDNYGGRMNDKRLTWHIDHIIPQSSFYFTSMDDPQFQECWAISNLRPLEKHANRAKSNKQD